MVSVEAPGAIVRLNALGANLRARLPEANGSYNVTLSSPEGDPLKSFTGRTSNGVIHIQWDLNLENGKKWTNDFASVFKITLSDSDRSQTLRGP